MADQRFEEISSPTASTDGRRGSGRAATGRNPVPLIVAALGAGVVLARLLDWRGHAHPRD
jgi:hypothetical protein